MSQEFLQENFSTLVKVVYVMSTGFMGLFGMQQLILIFWFWRSRQKNSLNQTSALPSAWPVVTVQLPLYNEPLVSERLLDAVFKLHYPIEKIEIQILDDSTDQTTEIIQQKIKTYSGAISVVHVTRSNRTGFKAGALQNGLPSAKGEFIAIFDADFLPDPDFLIKVIPFFSQQETAVVQSRWTHLNSKANMLTRLQSFGLDAHFTIEQNGRQAAGGLLNFNGTGGVWRKSAILDAGGWSDDTLTEDLDLSYRAQLRGWKIIYLDGVVCPGELPEDLRSLRSQQYRWNKGGAQTAIKMLGAVMGSKMAMAKKWHAFFHLNSSAIFPAIWIACLSGDLLLMIMQESSTTEVKFGLWMFSGFLTVLIFYGVSARINGYKIFPDVFLFLLFSLGLVWMNTKAVFSGWLGRKSDFVRTPKSGWKANKTIANTLPLTELWPEIFWGLVLIISAFIAWLKGVYWMMPLHLLTGSGLLMLVFYGRRIAKSQKTQGE